MDFSDGIAVGRTYQRVSVLRHLDLIRFLPLRRILLIAHRSGYIYSDGNVSYARIMAKKDHLELPAPSS